MQKGNDPKNPVLPEQRTNNTIQAFWVAFGSFSLFTFSIISAAILSRYLDKSEYGTYRQILYVYNTFLIIFTAGLPRIFSYYLPNYNLAKGKDIVSKINNLLLFTGLAFSIFLFSFAGLISSLLSNPALEIGLKYFSPIPMLLLPTLGIEGIFATYRKTTYIAIYNTLTRLFMLACIVIPVIVFESSYIYAIYGWIISSLISLLISHYFKSIPFRGIDAEKSLLSYREILSYSIPLAVASIASIAMRAADQFYISRYYGTNVFAEYANGFINIPFVTMITGAASTILLPVFSKLISEKSKIENILNLWKNALLKSAYLIYPIVVFFIFNAESLTIILYTEKYINSAIYFKISMVVNFFNIIVFAPLILASGKTRYYSNVHIVMACIAWIFGYLIVSAFKSPVPIAILSAALRISIVIILFKYVSHLLQVGIIELIPLREISLLILHSMSAAGITKYISMYYSDAPRVVGLMMSFVIFTILIIATQKMFNLSYTRILRPIGKYLQEGFRCS